LEFWSVGASLEVFNSKNNSSFLILRKENPQKVSRELLAAHLK